MKKTIKNLINRKLITSFESTVSYLQLFGFGLILTGIIVIFISGYCQFPSGIAISFFVIMLGLAFAFPTLLEGNDGLSTMRIVVFMVTNVICMLLLKIGWAENIHSLKEIGLDEWWMGVIAFVFGAKATQSYFDNAYKMNSKSQSISQDKPIETGTVGGNNPEISQIAIAQIAKVQNESQLYSRHSNIESVSDSLKGGKSCLTIYVKDDNVNTIPPFVEVELNENYILKVQTEIISNVGVGKLHYAQLTNDIVDSKTPDFYGSICCLVGSKLYPNFRAVVTSGHIFTRGEFANYDSFVTSDKIRDALSNGSAIGKLHFMEMNYSQDIAIVELKKDSVLPNECLSFSSGFYNCSVNDLSTEFPNVTILSKNNNSRDAYILDINVPMRVYYGYEERYVINIILIGSTRTKDDSKTISVGGDSGSCVYHKNGKIIGMLLGGNNKYSFVLPFNETLEKNNFKIL